MAHSEDAFDEVRPLTSVTDYGALKDNQVFTPNKNDKNKRRMNLSNSSRSSPPTLIKTQAGFWQDLTAFAEGSIPHSIVFALTIGAVCGIAAYVYYTCLYWALEYLWHTLPEKLASKFPQSVAVLWIPLVGFTMAFGVGLTVRFLGEPGDLPYTIKCVHEKAYVGMDHVLPMVAASQFSILAGGSLGPEAPLVAICAALGGFVSRSIFQVKNRNLVRKHTLMGMAGALAAFFGCPLGGSIFAMEVNSRFGIEYFEHTVEAIFCGEVCLVVFRALAGIPIESIWEITPMKLQSASPLDILYGAALGLIGAGVAALFAIFHARMMGFFTRNGLLEVKQAVPRAFCGAIVVVLLGMLVPHTMFWGENEFQTIATLSPASTLGHIWPTSGLLGFEMNSFWSSVIVGTTKLVAISFTVCGGFRGGYIFPAFASAAAFGRAIHFLFPLIPVQLCVLCMAAAVNAALTRTAIASTLILSFLAGEQACVSSILAASLVSLFATAYMPFIQTQRVRADIDASIYHSDAYAEVGDDCESYSWDGDTVMSTPAVELHKGCSGGTDDTREAV